MITTLLFQKKKKKWFETSQTHSAYSLPLASSTDGTWNKTQDLEFLAGIQDSGYIFPRK